MKAAGKRETAVWAVVIVMLLVAAISVFYLPEEIAVQWNSEGVSTIATRWLVFVFPALGILVSVLYLFQTKENTPFTWFGMAAVLLLLAAQIFIVGNALNRFHAAALDYPTLSAAALLTVGALLVFLGNRLPKAVRNYNCGVKAPWGYESDQLWTKTQKFSGRLWMSVGILVMLLAFVPGIFQPLLLAAAIGALLLFPRLYSRYLYEKEKGRK